jgi:outer membrane protein OmpA-like peptidoglycan-associated protein
VALFGLLLSRPATLHAQEIPWSVRSAAGLAMMVSSYQREEIDSLRMRDEQAHGYDRVGIVGEMQLAYRVLPWLDAKAGVIGGAFLASHAPTGGLLAPTLGALATLTHHELHPYVQLDMGAAFTGPLLKPFLRAGVGIDLELSRAFMFGPTLGYGQVFQTDEQHGSPDARFVWIGLALSYRPVRQPPAPARKRGPPAPPPPVMIPPAPIEPSTQLLDLIERTLPTDPSRVELLAPVLFEFDSDVLQPVGTAMLHEVARELQKRPELELIEIQGYADRRGGSAYNRELSNRRAQRVFDWLVENEVDPVRLRIAAEGATGFVEPGRNEGEHEQNRRVVFRVIRVREP